MSGQFFYTLLNAAADLGEDTQKIRELLEAQLEAETVADGVKTEIETPNYPSSPEFPDNADEGWR